MYPEANTLTVQEKALDREIRMKKHRQMYGVDSTEVNFLYFPPVPQSIIITTKSPS